MEQLAQGPEYASESKEMDWGEGISSLKTDFGLTISPSLGTRTDSVTVSSRVRE